LITTVFPRRERGRDRHRREQQRRVPRGDHADDPEGLAKRVVEHALAVERDDAALHLVGEAAEVVQPLRHHPHLGGHLAQELAVLTGLDDRELVGVLRDQIAETHQEPAPAGR
jgi:hypothetical protein